jgi:hypothetical protein
MPAKKTGSLYKGNAGRYEGFVEVDPSHAFGDGSGSFFSN